MCYNFPLNPSRMAAPQSGGQLLFLLLPLVFQMAGAEGVGGGGLLYPQDSETRERRSLDGIWDFRIAPRNDPDLGFREEWQNRPLRQSGVVDLMPVPSSYNEVGQNKSIRDHVGWAWYDRQFRLPPSWLSNQRIWIRFGGVNYHAIVWVNGLKVVEHRGGHLPFLGELDPTTLLPSNRVTVAINNTLTPTTIPQGRTTHQNAPRYPKDYFTLDYSFDFFNYAGIHRTVYLYTTPITHINDITTSTNILGVDGKGSCDKYDKNLAFTGTVSYGVELQPPTQSQSASLSHFPHPNALPLPHIPNEGGFKVQVKLEDKEGSIVASNNGAKGVLHVSNAKLWWPFTMVKNDGDAGYLYTLVVVLKDGRDREVDVYRLKVGIRTVRWSSDSFFINNRPFYFRGFGRHEDFNIRGKGIDAVMLVKDHNLVRWTGANSYRTSHYPYAEEIMDLTDQLGIVIIDEISAVSLDGFGPELLAAHKNQLAQLIARDKNRASVVMWSVANEPASHRAEAGPYFREVFELARSLDEHPRPVTIVLNQQWSQDKAAEYADIICINRYYAWYSDTGHTEVITASITQDVTNWRNKFKRPVIIAEYGADTVAGLHMSPEFVFTEEFQLEYLREHFKAFDALREAKKGLIGEMIWNFADFMTGQGITRIVGNRKGIFTRDRQPKASAHLIRTRYHLLANATDSYPMPQDIQTLIPLYTSSQRHSEL